MTRYEDGQKKWEFSTLTQCTLAEQNDIYPEMSGPGTLGKSSKN